MDECTTSEIYCRDINVTMECDGCSGTYSLQSYSLYQRPVYTLTDDVTALRTLRMEHSSCKWRVFHQEQYPLADSVPTRQCDPYTEVIFPEAEIVCI